jgi:AbrB family looped-hinge helix DNA binding protein
MKPVGLESLFMNIQRGKLVSGGRLQLPAELRRELSLADGDTVLMEVVDGELHVRPLRDAVARVQARLRQFVPADVSLSDELIADRRAAADRE